MRNEITLGGVKFPETTEEIHTWNYVDILDKYDTTRLYYKINEGGADGFKFYCLGVNSFSPEDMWNLKDSEVECIAFGYANFDGVRHLYWGDEQTENEGYHYYPSFPILTEFLSQLKILENKYCNK